MSDVSVEVQEQRDGCPSFRAGRLCDRCQHLACGWCDECHPEVPEW